jgi:folate-binding protein YgfZ
LYLQINGPATFPEGLKPDIARSLAAHPLYNGEVLNQYYEAARTGAVVADKDLFGIVKIAGPDRVAWLQGMVSNDVGKLTPGTGCYAAHLNAQGRIVGHMAIHATEQAFWLSLERAAIEKLVAAFDKLLIMEDVQITDVSSEHDIISVIGPRAAGAIENWLGMPLKIGGIYSHAEFEHCRVVVSELGYDLWVHRDRGDIVLRGLADAGTTAIDHGTWDVLRTEAGLPIYGIDIDETTTLPELGERGISYDKGCYIGQEVVAKIKYLGHVNRRFVGIEMQTDKIPDMKSRIQKNGKDVGYVTTALFSPGLKKPIALGFVTRTAYATGNEVEIISEKQTIAAKIVELPFSTHINKN